jgi:hypothetical protein
MKSLYAEEFGNMKIYSSACTQKRIMNWFDFGDIESILIRKKYFGLDIYILLQYSNSLDVVSLREHVDWLDEFESESVFDQKFYISFHSDRVA